MKNTLLPVPDGFKMRIEHFFGEKLKECIESGELPVHGSGPAYATVAQLVETETGEVVSFGVSYCHGKKDLPSRKLGRLIAHNRAIKAYESLSRLFHSPMSARDNIHAPR